MTTARCAVLILSPTMRRLWGRTGEGRAPPDLRVDCAELHSFAQFRMPPLVNLRILRVKSSADSGVLGPIGPNMRTTGAEEG